MIKEAKQWFKDVEENFEGILFAIWIFVLAAAMNYVAGNYVSNRDGTIINDLILDNIPTVNLTWLFVWGILLISFLLLTYPLIFHPKYLPFVIYQVAILILIRNFFVILTSMQLPTPNFTVDFPPFADNWSFKNDLFFSGHVAIPFLGYLIFKKEKISILFLSASILMATTVLLTKLHYSIDVFAAFFITYASYNLGKNLLKRKIFRTIKPKK